MSDVLEAMLQLPAHLALLTPPPGVRPAATFDESAATAAFASPSALDDACSQIESVRQAGGVALVREPALALCVAHLVAYGRSRLADAISLVAAQLAACRNSESQTPAEPSAWLQQAELCALLRLELHVRGQPSDLSTVLGCPSQWLWLHWSDGGSLSTVVGRGHVIEVERLRPDPRLAQLRRFCSATEAEHIIQLARASLHPSRVVNHSAHSGEALLSDARTSYSCKVAAAADVVVMRAVQRAAYLCGMSPQHAEAVQMVHYLPGQEYRPHFDWFSSRDARFADKTREMGNRLVSFFIYLSGCDAGGHTSFPRLQHSFAPEAGCGVVWYNLDRNGLPDERTLHAGCPVERGEKWGLNIWLRERPRRVPQPRVRAALSLGQAATEAGLGKAGGQAVGVVGAALPGAPGAACPRVRVTLSMRTASPANPARCSGCGDDDTPLGLCLCRERYQP